MKPERWQQVERLYNAAMERKPDERAAFLENACADDENLRHEVASLMAAGNRVGSFLEPPADDSASDAPASPEQPLIIGAQVGAYRILSLLGEGGMGEVHLALDTRLNRKVAIKVLRAEFTVDAQRVQRFE